MTSRRSTTATAARIDYVLADNGVVYIVSTSEPALAADALKALP